METALFLAALLISLVSLALHFHGHLRDRAKIDTFCEFYRGNHKQHDLPVFKVSVINRGPRPVILRMIGCTTANNKWSGTYLKGESSGIPLGEGERFDQRMEDQDLIYDDHEGNVEDIVKLWVEDSLGRRMVVRNSRTNIVKYWDNWIKLRKS